MEWPNQRASEYLLVAQRRSRGLRNSAVSLGLALPDGPSICLISLENNFDFRIVAPFQLLDLFA
jgi:hypothetical protein